MLKAGFSLFLRHALPEGMSGHELSQVGNDGNVHPFRRIGLARQTEGRRRLPVQVDQPDG